MENIGEHQSIWTATVKGDVYKPLTDDIEVDVTVIGAGITGLTAALLLSRAGKKVAVLERDCIASGTTGMSSSHLTSMTDLAYSEIEKKYGINFSKTVSESMVQSIDLIQKIVTEYNIECGFSRVNGYYFCENDKGIEIVNKEYEASKRAGQLVNLTDNIPLPFPAIKGFSVQNQALFNPVAYCNGLARAIFENESNVYTQTQALDITDGQHCVVNTANGVVKSQSIFMATHIPIGINPLQGSLSIERSYAIAVNILQPNIKGLFWNTADPYEYIRPYLTPNGTETIIIGGKDHETGHGDPVQSLRQLIEYSKNRFNINRVLYNWSAQHYDPVDSLPYIGKSPFSNNIYIGTGFSGDGLVLGTLAAKVVSDLIIKKESPFAEIYNPSRLKISSIPEFVSTNLSNAKHFLVDRFKSGKNPDKLAIEESTVHGIGTPEAVYKDSTGKLHKCSAICSHLQCIVQWNDLEKSWDCPCHGSRFGINGIILEGPALKDLTKNS